jgi:DNA adenine methylase
MNSNTVLQKPFLKWVGGKSQHIHQIINSFPDNMENYHEIFLGGGSVLLAVLSLQKAGKITIKGSIYAYDLNHQLIQVYRHIQSNKDELIKCVEQYRNEYDNCPTVEKGTANRKPINETEAKTSRESYYYWMRKKFNALEDLSIENSALFIMLNKTGFRGVYREGPNGYNVPFGHYKKTPAIITRSEIDKISNLIKDVVFITADFTNSINNATEGDFIYLDPPYAPKKRTSFVGYTENGFDIDMHKNLFKLTKALTTNNIKFAMSNANVELVKKSFDGYTFTEIAARRAIHSKNPAAKTTDVLIVS